ncbi:MAG: bifunctional [glutamine synthetase] adenylyltransferase/[glutamine synthetase]-adenylyl-L-tyrosine phosphorylase [Pseudomonadota bacterium]
MLEQSEAPELNQKLIPLNENSAETSFNEWVEETEFSGALTTEQARLLGGAFSLSPYLKNCAERAPEFTERVFSKGFDAAFNELIANTLSLGQTGNTEQEFMKALRVAKRHFALLCGLADLGGEWHGKTVTKAVSDFARASLSASLDFLLLKYAQEGKFELVDENDPQHDCGLIVLGMGKFGADELNYSSDIDLIIFHDDAAGMKVLSDDPITVLNRMAKLWVKLMQERTADGYVFRTDLRLRPDPSSTPLIIPVQAALHYYEGQGQNWERAAMIKASPVVGDVKSGEWFLKELTPFVWRKYLDFAAIQDVHSIKRQIHAHKGHGEIRVNGHNIKLGRGGIREIEFFVQTQQLIAGGRNPQLRCRGTQESLEALQKEGWIEENARTELTEAYWYLRNLEHRLQMVDDQQTHSLPDANEDLERIAAMNGESDVNVFGNKIKQTLQTVEAHYAGLFEAAPELSTGGGNLVFTGQDDDPDTINTLETLGFQQPSSVIKIVKNWHVAKIPALQTSQARELLTELVPELLETFGKSSDPDKILFTFDEFLSGLPAGIQLFSILKSNPALNALLVRILTAAPAMAEQISRKPHVFDAMLEPQVANEVPSKEYLETALLTGMASIENYEMKLDQARRFFREIRFQISARLFAGSLDYSKTELAVSNLAEAMVDGLLKIVEEEFAKRHGRIPGARMCVLAMGRLGSRELSVGSDLDLIFLYDFDEDAYESDGEKPLDSTLYFIRFMQRFIAAMSSPTAEGKIFELDFRLRPSGNAGPLATHVSAFLKYQKEDAWIWESQALTRARPVAGNEGLCAAISAEIPGILNSVTAGKKLKSEIYKMRMRIEEEKGSDNPWDVKVCKGGLIDIEFISQWLVLENLGDNPLPTGTRNTLQSTVAASLPQDAKEAFVTAFDLYSTIIHLLRTCVGDDGFNQPFPQGFQEVICSTLDLPDVATVEAHLKNTQKEVRAHFKKLLG